MTFWCNTHAKFSKSRCNFFYENLKILRQFHPKACFSDLIECNESIKERFPNIESICLLEKCFEGFSVGNNVLYWLPLNCPPKWFDLFNPKGTDQSFPVMEHLFFASVSLRWSYRLLTTPSMRWSSIGGSKSMIKLLTSY